MTTTVKFAKVKEGAIVPSKRDEDAGFDIYACFDKDFIKFEPHETQIIPTGIASACDKDYCFVLFERGSTGSKGIARRCGILDSGYRNEWFVCLTNTTDYPLYISKLTKEELIEKGHKHYKSKFLNRLSTIFSKIFQIDDLYWENVTVYPYTKAIAQALVVPVPQTTVEEISYEKLQNIESERGMGALGSSNK